MTQEGWRHHGEHDALDGGENEAVTRARGGWELSVPWRRLLMVTTASVLSGVGGMSST